jgi:hypothetical protein
MSGKHKKAGDFKVALRSYLDSTVASLGQVRGDVDLSNVRVLIVDDDGDAREMLRHVLQEYGAK